jgi:succinate dehydrogenase/fumarate reductase cytochrome b subunit
MNAAKTRIIHRRLGIAVAFFLSIQAIAGMFMSVGRLASFDTSFFYNVLYSIHAGWNPLGSIYRVALGCATALQAILGIMLFLNRFHSRTAGKTISTIYSTPDEQHGLKKDVRTGTLSFATDIRPLFRDKDIESMKPNGIDLSSYEDVKRRIQDIYERLAAKEMPCDGPWGESNMRKLKMWMDSGMTP